MTNHTEGGGGGRDARFLRPRVFRASSTLLSFWVVVAMLAFFLGDAAVRGSWLFLAKWTAPLLLIGWGAWLLFWRSQVRADRDGAVVINALRIHDLPWSSVEEVVQSAQLRVVLLRLRPDLHASWSSRFDPRPGPGSCWACSTDGPADRFRTGSVATVARPVPERKPSLCTDDCIAPWLPCAPPS